jgi:hypothetical protein
MIEGVSDNQDYPQQTDIQHQVPSMVDAISMKLEGSTQSSILAARYKIIAKRLLKSKHIVAQQNTAFIIV